MFSIVMLLEGNGNVSPLQLFLNPFVEHFQLIPFKEFGLVSTALSIREIVVHYSKYRHAGVIETEACIKAVHVLIEQVGLCAAQEKITHF